MQTNKKVQKRCRKRKDAAERKMRREDRGGVKYSRALLRRCIAASLRRVRPAQRKLQLQFQGARVPCQGAPEQAVRLLKK